MLILYSYVQQNSNIQLLAPNKNIYHRQIPIANGESIGNALLYFMVVLSSSKSLSFSARLKV